MHAETLRRWMLEEAGLWQRQRRARSHIASGGNGKAHFGELVQMDGSFHALAGGTRTEGCLMHMVDDATDDKRWAGAEEETIWAAAASVAALDRAVRSAAWRSTRTGRTCTCGAHRSQELLGGEDAGDAVWAHVREAGHSDHRGEFAAGQRASGAGARHASGPAGEEAAAGRRSPRYDASQCAIWDQDYLAEHNRRYAQAAAAAADYHRRRPRARQLDEVFWLEEERVVSEDWVVRYQNRLLQLERPSRPRIPAKSRVLVRENQVGEIAIHYREHRLVFRDLKAASTELSGGRGAAPSPAPPSPRPKSCIPAPDHPWRRNRYQQMKTPIFSAAW